MVVQMVNTGVHMHSFKLASLQGVFVYSHMIMWTKQTNTDHLMMLTLITVGGKDTPTSDQSPFMPSATMQPDGKCY